MTVCQSAMVPPPHPPMASTSANTGKKVFAIPPPLDQLDVKEYLDVQFWDAEDWTDYKTKKLKANKAHHKLRFMEGENGEAVSVERLAKMTKTAQELWNELYSTRQNPTTWSKVLYSDAQHFCRTMQSEYYEFRLCDGTWKADVFATIRFPDWSRSARSSGNLRREFEILTICVSYYFFSIGAEPSIDTNQPQSSSKVTDPYPTKKRKLAGRSRDGGPQKKKKSAKGKENHPPLHSGSDSEPVIMHVGSRTASGKSFGCPSCLHTHVFASSVEVMNQATSKSPPAPPCLKSPSVASSSTLSSVSSQAPMVVSQPAITALASSSATSQSSLTAAGPVQASSALGSVEIDAVGTAESHGKTRRSTHQPAVRSGLIIPFTFYLLIPVFNRRLNS